jgi:hypothetical protein
MMRTFAIVLALCAAGCGPILYYGVPKTRTYEYERRVPIVVDSEPAGATITTADGRVIGTAPAIVEERVKVRRTHRSLDASRALIGCMVDIAAGVSSVIYWADRRDDTVAKVGLVVGMGMFAQCTGLAVIKLYNLGIDPLYRSAQAPPIFTSAERDDEEVVSRNVELVAKWEHLPEVRTKITLPAQRAVTIELARRFTFDEARLLWQAQQPKPVTGAAP